MSVRCGEETEMLGSRMDGSVGEGLSNEVKAGNSLRSTDARAGVRAVA